MKKIAAICALSVMCSAVPLYAAADNDISVVLNGTEIVFDVPPTLINSRTMVPMRAIFEALGYSVAWNGDTKTITAVNGRTDSAITMTLGKNEMTYNSKKITLDAAPTLINDRTLVPVRAISEASGCEVTWDGATKTVTITDPNVTYAAPVTPEPTASPAPSPTPPPTASPAPTVVVYDKTSIPTYNGAKSNPIVSRDGRRLFYYTTTYAADGRRIFKSYIQKLRDSGYTDDERITLRGPLGTALRSKDGTYTVIVTTEYRSITEFDAATTFRAYVVLIDNTVEDRDEYTEKMADEKHYDNTCVPRVEEVTNTVLNKRLYVNSKINQYWPAFKYAIMFGNVEKYTKELTDNGYTRSGGAHVLYNVNYPCYVSHGLSEIVGIYPTSGYLYVVPESLFSEK